MRFHLLLTLLLSMLSPNAVAQPPADIPSIGACATAPTPECLLEQAIHTRPSSLEDRLTDALASVPVGQGLRDRLERHFRSRLAALTELPGARDLPFETLRYLGAAGGREQAAQVARDTALLLTPIAQDPDGDVPHTMTLAVRALAEAGLAGEAHQLVEKAGHPCARLALATGIEGTQATRAADAREDYRRRLSGWVAEVEQIPVPVYAWHRDPYIRLQCRDIADAAKAALQRLAAGKTNSSAVAALALPDSKADAAEIEAALDRLERGELGLVGEQLGQTFEAWPFTGRIERLGLRDRQGATALLTRLWKAVLAEPDVHIRRAFVGYIVARSVGGRSPLLEEHEEEARRAMTGGPPGERDTCMAILAFGQLGMAEEILQLRRSDGRCGGPGDVWPTLTQMVRSGHHAQALALLERGRQGWDWASPEWAPARSGCALIREAAGSATETLPAERLRLLRTYPACLDPLPPGQSEREALGEVSHILGRQATQVAPGGWQAFIESQPPELHGLAARIAFEAAARRGEIPAIGDVLDRVESALAPGCDGGREAASLLGPARVLRREAQVERLLTTALTALEEGVGRCVLDREGYIDTALALHERRRR